MSSRPDLMAGLRLRIPLIVVIPIGALLVIAVATIGFSRILLALPPEAATTVALATSANILIACALVANKPRMDSVTAAELLVVVSYPILIGFVLTQVNIGGGGHGGHAAEAAAPAGGAGTIAASGVAFDENTFTFPEGEEATLTFENEDSVAHNVAIYTDDSASDALFKGANIEGGQSIDYDIPAMEAGEYFFRCDLHPTSMVGTVTVE